MIDGHTIHADGQMIHKVLLLLDKYKGDESFDYELISASALKMKYAEWERMMCGLQDVGYIRGLIFTQTLSDGFPRLVEPIHPRITLKGMEYLEENI